MLEILDKLRKLTRDEKNDFEYLMEVNGIEFNKINEKLHSLTQWLDMFLNAFIEYDIEGLRKLDINRQTLEFINYISICNGIIDVSEGVQQVTEKCFNVEKRKRITGCFDEARKLNRKHDKYFKISSKTDKDYFKHIRAIFGQHPSNLEYKNKSSKCRAFSSWTFNSKRRIYNFSSDIHTNIYFDQAVSAWGIKFHVYYNEIENFTKQHLFQILYMIDIMNDEIYENRVKSCEKILNWSNELSETEK